MSVTAVASVVRTVEVEADTEEEARDQAINLACVDAGFNGASGWEPNGLLHGDSNGMINCKPDAEVITEEESEDEYWDRYVEEQTAACPVKFKDVSGVRGAPMGRSNVTEDFEKPCHLVEVPLDEGGYDPGGAYWGSGAPGLYCAANGLVGTDARHCSIFVRANSLKEAREIIQTRYPEIKWIQP